MSISNQLISKLKELKKDNSIESYSHIKNILFNPIARIYNPCPIARIYNPCPQSKTTKIRLHHKSDFII